MHALQREINTTLFTTENNEETASFPFSRWEKYKLQTSFFGFDTSEQGQKDNPG